MLAHLQDSPVEGDDMTLSKDWCSLVVASGVDCTKPGIYRWEIEGGGIYIGKYTNIRRPTKEYRRNVVRILKQLPSHHPNGRFRRIHHALAAAVTEGRRITLTILANSELGDLNRREQEFIRSEGANLNGPASGPILAAPSDIIPD
jgi:hypothetical protein